MDEPPMTSHNNVIVAGGNKCFSSRHDDSASEDVETWNRGRFLNDDGVPGTFMSPGCEAQKNRSVEGWSGMWETVNRS